MTTDFTMRGVIGSALATLDCRLVVGQRVDPHCAKNAPKNLGSAMALNPSALYATIAHDVPTCSTGSRNA